jgi:Fic/DOC family
VILFELTGGREDHPSYQELEIANGARQYDFLRSTVTACLAMGKPFISETIIKAFNYHAIACLHSYAGEYRPCPVTVGTYQPPEHYRVPALMEDFINRVNRDWATADPVALAAYALWRLNNIHPFINGNGRSARAVSYFILCVSAGGLLPGSPILPELIRANRAAYVDALRQADLAGDLSQLHAYLADLLVQQIGSGAPTEPAMALTSDAASDDDGVS